MNKCKSCGCEVPEPDNICIDCFHQEEIGMESSIKLWVSRDLAGDACDFFMQAEKPEPDKDGTYYDSQMSVRHESLAIFDFSLNPGECVQIKPVKIERAKDR